MMCGFRQSLSKSQLTSFQKVTNSKIIWQFKAHRIAKTILIKRNNMEDSHILVSKPNFGVSFAVSVFLTLDYLEVNTKY